MKSSSNSAGVRIAYLADHLDVLPTLVEWAMATWGHLEPSRTPDQVHAAFARRANRCAIPCTQIALDGHGVVGMVSLVEQDLTTRPELTPWLAAVFVTPQARRRGIGEQLVRAAVAEANALDVQRLYLITPDQMAFYRRLGWTQLEATSYRGEMVHVMWIDPADGV